MLARNPCFTAVAVLTLTLGIGANTAIFSVVNAVLLRPLPFEAPDRLVQVWHTPPKASFPGIPEFTVSPANFLDWRSRNHVFEGMSAYGFGRYTLTGAGHPDSFRVVAVTSGFFSILRAKPVLGAVFHEGDVQPGGDHEVVLSYAVWRTHFGADPSIVGKTIELNGQPFTILGVIGSQFEFPISTDVDSSPQMWKPLAWSDQERAVRDDHNYGVIARLKSGVTLKQAQAELDAISNNLAGQYPQDNKGWGAIAVSLRDDLVSDVRPSLLILLGTVAFVLLVACANVANLLLVKSLSRRKEVAIRTALGAGRRRLLLQALAEPLLLALAGGALGLLFAHYGIAFIVKFMAQSLPRSLEIGLDNSVLAFTLGISLLTGFACGLFPAIRLTKADLNQALKQGLGRASSDSGGNRMRALLVVSELALSLMLLIGAGLLIRSLWILQNVNPGFDPNSVATMDISVPESRFSEPAQQIRFFNSVLDRVRTLPRVESAGLIDRLPLSGNGSHQPVAIEGAPPAPMSALPEVDVRVISTGYLSAMHIALLRGHDFNDTEANGQPGAVLISESMAKFFWQNADPIGKRLTLYFFPNVTRTVVGVVGDVKLDSLNETRPTPTLYYPLDQLSPARGESWHSFGLTLAVRARANPVTVVPGVTSSIHEVDPDIPVLNVQTMRGSVSASLSPQRFTMLLLASFAGLALLLAVIGTYSVMSFSVSRATQEIGIRITLGAQRRDVLKLVLGEGAKTALIGVAGGLAGALALTRLMASVLFGVTATDPITFAAVAVFLAFVALLACYFPARRATRVDPMVALRYE